VSKTRAHKHTEEGVVGGKWGGGMRGTHPPARGQKPPEWRFIELSPRQLQIGLTNAIGRQGSCLNVGNVSARKLAFICITVKSYLHMHVCTWPGRTLQQIAATKALKRDDRCRESWQKLGGR